MNIANFLIIFFCSLYTIHLIKMLFFKKQRNSLVLANKRLEELRAKPFKTVEEQKEFVNMRYPKFWGRFSFKSFFTIKGLGTTIFQIGLFIFVIRIYMFLFLFFNINLRIWMALAIIFLLPVCLNFVLKKFGIQQQDISVFFR